MELTEVILQHVLVTVVIVLVGLLVGGGLGFLFAWLFKMLYKAVPGLQPPLMLLPWRTVLFSVVMFFISPMAFFMIRNFEPQGLMTGLYPGLVFILLAFFLTLDTTLNNWLPIGLGARLTALARTLAVASGILIAVGVEYFSAGILWHARAMVARTFEPDGFWIMLGVVMGLGLAFDLLLGVVQMLLAYAERRRAVKQAPVAVEK
ncbi:MAG: hypothetical protein AB1531_09500 [Chloroflexota bacterium]